LQAGAAFQRVGHGGRQRLVVEEIDQQAVAAVLDHFFHRRGARGNDQAARAHRLHQRPRQHERIGQVGVHRRHLHQLPSAP
jgi:hypothetical protein